MYKLYAQGALLIMDYALWNNGYLGVVLNGDELLEVGDGECRVWRASEGMAGVFENLWGASQDKWSLVSGLSRDNLRVRWPYGGAVSCLWEGKIMKSAPLQAFQVSLVAKADPN